VAVSANYGKVEKQYPDNKQQKAGKKDDLMLHHTSKDS
jgi:hypothetical protein